MTFNFETIRQSKISQPVTQLIFEQLRKKCNLTDLNPILDRIDSITTDFNCSHRCNNGDKNEGEDDDSDKKNKKEKLCFLCGGRHEYRPYQCKYECGVMKANHNTEECWKSDKNRKRGRSQDRRERSKSKERNSGYRKTDERRKTRNPRSYPMSQ